MNVEIYQLSDGEFGCFIIGDTYVGVINLHENEFAFQFYSLNYLTRMNSKQMKSITKKIDQLNKTRQPAKEQEIMYSELAVKIATVTTDTDEGLAMYLYKKDPLAFSVVVDMFKRNITIDDAKVMLKNAELTYAQVEVYLAALRHVYKVNAWRRQIRRISRISGRR